MTDPDLLLAAGFDPSGAYGPTIVLQLTSQSAVAWLRQLFADVSEGVKQPQLGSQAGVRLDGIAAIELRLTGREDENQELVRVDDAPTFVWCCTAERWQRNAELLDPFLAGRTGHQYLTSEQTDDALVEVSFGESHPGL